MRPKSESLSFLTRPNLNGYTGRSQATAMSKPDKTFPLLILPVLPSLHNLGVWTVRVQIEWLPIQSRVVVLIMSTGSEGWQTGPYVRGQSFCSHLNQLSLTLGPPLNQGVPDHPNHKVIRVKTLHHTHFEKHFLLKTHTFSQIICNKYIKDWLRQAAWWP
jgi:hypothetical protein